MKVRDDIEAVRASWPFEQKRPLRTEEWTWCLHCERYERFGDWEYDPRTGMVEHGRDGCDGSALDCFMRGGLPQLVATYGPPNTESAEED